MPYQSILEHLGETFTKLWDDAHHGRVFLLRDLGDDALQGLVSCSYGRVQKLLADRTVSPEGRDIHDCRPVNEDGSKYDHPPALQATHRYLARLVLWWKERHPHIPLRICKIDVAKAFKWIFIALRDLGLFATDLPASLIDLPTVVVVIATFRE